MTLPHEFIARTEALIGKEFPQLEAALQTESPVSIRINRSKGVAAPAAEAVDWSQTGYYLPERLSFTFDPLFHAGAYYVQEASSMFLEQAIRQYIKEPVTCLDLCAAPGGKSTHLASILPEGSLLVSNEVIRSRSHILAENLSKWGNPNVVVANNDPEEIGKLTHFFDLIVTDVPCSGEGMFRKDPESITEWSVANVNLCAARQRRILHDTWNALKPGGLLIYSTCTYNIEENEENILHFIQELEAEVLPVSHPEAWKISGSLRGSMPVYHFFPHQTKGEGFFLAVLRKRNDEHHNGRPTTKTRKEKVKNVLPVPNMAKNWLLNPEDYRIEMRGDQVQAIPLRHYASYLLLAESLRIVSAFLPMGEMKGKDCIPSQELALSTSLNKAAFPLYESDWNEAIRYLKKEALTLPPTVEKGYVLMCYKGYPLGFVKNLGTRANNLYPTEWRIRSGYLPEELKCFTP